MFCYAIGYNELSEVGNLDTPDVGSEFTININVIGGESASKTINTLSGSTSGQVGDLAYAVWQGNLVSGQSCPDKDPFKAAYVNGAWRTIDESSYSQYKLFVSEQSIIGRCGTSPSRSCLDGWFSDATNVVNQAKLSKSLGSVKNSASLNNAFVSVVTDTPLQFPLTSLYIKADSIGIFTPVPDIRINSATSPCFKTGSGNGIITAQITNIGQERGAFTAFAQCSSPFASTGNVQGTLESGASRTINLALSASASQKELSTCVVVVESVGETESRIVNVCVDPQITCTVPNPQTFCAIDGNNEVVKQCSVDGATSRILETCKSTEVCDDGECILDSDGGGGLGIIDRIRLFFSDLISGTFDFLVALKYFIIFIVSSLIIFASNELLERIKALKKNNALRITFAIAIGVGIGYLLFLFIGSLLFWGLSIGGFLFFLFSNQIKKFIGL